jgi:Na+/H+-dicarboxylate symporter
VVLGAIVCGALLGYFWPAAGVALKPFGDGFIALIKMLIAPVIFLTVVLGIAGGAAPGSPVGALDGPRPAANGRGGAACSACV